MGGGAPALCSPRDAPGPVPSLENRQWPRGTLLGTRSGSVCVALPVCFRFIHASYVVNTDLAVLGGMICIYRLLFFITLKIKELRSR